MQNTRDAGWFGDTNELAKLVDEADRPESAIGRGDIAAVQRPQQRFIREHDLGKPGQHRLHRPQRRERVVAALLGKLQRGGVVERQP